MKRWIYRLRLAGSHPGEMARISNVFASRGINLESLLGSALKPQPACVIDFRASERLHAHLLRRLRRLNDVASVVSRELSEDEPPPNLWDILLHGFPETHDGACSEGPEP